MLSDNRDDSPPQDTAIQTCPSPMSVHDDVPVDQIVRDEPVPNSGPQAFVINTKFDVNLDTNKKTNCRGMSTRERFRETQKERKHAAYAKVPISLEDLKEQVKPLYYGGSEHDSLHA